MSAYGGYIQFQNFLRSAISTGTAYHSTSDYGQESINLAGLAAGATSMAVPFYTSTSNRDTWGFSATTTAGATYSGSVTFGFQEQNGGSTVILQAIIANSSTKTFNVYIPPPSTYSDVGISTSSLEAQESQEG